MVHGGSIEQPRNRVNFRVSSGFNPWLNELNLDEQADPIICCGNFIRCLHRKLRRDEFRYAGGIWFKKQLETRLAR